MILCFLISVSEQRVDPEERVENVNNFILDFLLEKEKKIRELKKTLYFVFFLDYILYIFIKYIHKLRNV